MVKWLTQLENNTWVGVEHIHKCDPDKWSKLEIDDALEKVGVDARGLDYYFLMSGMSMDEGLIRFFDNNSSMEMTVLGVDRGVVDLYAVEANEVLHSQTTPRLGKVTHFQLFS